jgi:hypothetical protein
MIIIKMMKRNKIITTREKQSTRKEIKEIHQRGAKNGRQIVGISVRHLHFKKNRCITELKKV